MPDKYIHMILNKILITTDTTILTPDSINNKPFSKIYYKYIPNEHIYNIINILDKNTTESVNILILLLLLTQLDISHIYIIRKIIKDILYIHSIYELLYNIYICNIYNNILYILYNIYNKILYKEDKYDILYNIIISQEYKDILEYTISKEYTEYKEYMDKTNCNRDTNNMTNCNRDSGNVTNYIRNSGNMTNYNRDNTNYNRDTNNNRDKTNYSEYSENKTNYSEYINNLTNCNRYDTNYTNYTEYNTNITNYNENTNNMTNYSEIYNEIDRLCYTQEYTLDMKQEYTMVPPYNDINTDINTTKFYSINENTLNTTDRLNPTEYTNNTLNTKDILRRIRLLLPGCMKLLQNTYKNGIPRGKSSEFFGKGSAPRVRSIFHEEFKGYNDIMADDHLNHMEKKIKKRVQGIELAIKAINQIYNINIFKNKKKEIFPLEILEKLSNKIITAIKKERKSKMKTKNLTVKEMRDRIHIKRIFSKLFPESASCIILLYKHNITSNIWQDTLFLIFSLKITEKTVNKIINKINNKIIKKIDTFQKRIKIKTKTKTLSKVLTKRIKSVTLKYLIRKSPAHILSKVHRELLRLLDLGLYKDISCSNISHNICSSISHSICSNISHNVSGASNCSNISHSICSNTKFTNKCVENVTNNNFPVNNVTNNKCVENVTNNKCVSKYTNTFTTHDHSNSCTASHNNFTKNITTRDPLTNNLELYISIIKDISNIIEEKYPFVSYEKIKKYCMDRIVD
ncbi:uncharacterized protein NESG_00558 [Nematocida ausubeli]|uniref:Uncharacterized protein n=1 Tax=Nematocida ausubeli (strain ATCC PRA-371 / ERTm2) TaxID=1913371 RepID=A0A086J5R1_NEMA1|nr:uncharacterized protein NESG_00558 [Nematocida ausubeli]KFG27479.1 hypothetical protein NESG_00558 [Nematocida ausubeli]